MNEKKKIPGWVEFLQIYGWAILVVLVMFGALMYFGVIKLW